MICILKMLKVMAVSGSVMQLLSCMLHRLVAEKECSDSSDAGRTTHMLVLVSVETFQLVKSCEDLLNSQNKSQLTKTDDGGRDGLCHSFQAMGALFAFIRHFISLNP